jgi:hypothetical protein
MAGIVGGTASAVGGGKFANGAYTAAFQHLLNAEAPKLLKKVYAFAMKGDGENAFYDRALVGAGGHQRALRVSDGKEIVNWTYQFSNADVIDIHAHGYEGGVIGAAQNSSGIYTHKVKHGGDGAYASEFAAALAHPGVLRKDGLVRIFSCNGTGIASEVAFNLAKLGRSDVTVIGANDNVGPLEGKLASFVRAGGMFNHYQGNRYIKDERFLQWKP